MNSQRSLGFWGGNEAEGWRLEVGSGMMRNLPLPEGSKEGDCWGTCKIQSTMSLCKTRNRGMLIRGFGRCLGTGT